MFAAFIQGASYAMNVIGFLFKLAIKNGNRRAVREYGVNESLVE